MSNNGAMPEWAGVCRADADTRTAPLPAVVPTKADPRVGKTQIRFGAIVGKQLPRLLVAGPDRQLERYCAGSGERSFDRYCPSSLAPMQRSPSWRPKEFAVVNFDYTSPAELFTEKRRGSSGGSHMTGPMDSYFC